MTTVGIGVKLIQRGEVGPIDPSSFPFSIPFPVQVNPAKTTISDIGLRGAGTDNQATRTITATHLVIHPSTPYSPYISWEIKEEY